MRRKDLRALKAGDVFHLLPARTDEPGVLAQLWATHPRLHRRLAQLEELELRLQRARY
jgi:Zn-dependent protease with chaperone function